MEKNCSRVKCAMEMILRKIIMARLIRTVLIITINRPERRNAFRPNTVKKLIRAFNDARDDNSIGVIILTGKLSLSDLNLVYACTKDRTLMIDAQAREITEKDLKAGIE